VTQGYLYDAGRGWLTSTYMYRTGTAVLEQTDDKM